MHLSQGGPGGPVHVSAPLSLEPAPLLQPPPPLVGLWQGLLPCQPKPPRLLAMMRSAMAGVQGQGTREWAQAVATHCRGPLLQARPLLLECLQRTRWCHDSTRSSLAQSLCRSPAAQDRVQHAWHAVHWRTAAPAAPRAAPASGKHSRVQLEALCVAHKQQQVQIRHPHAWECTSSCWPYVQRCLLAPL